MRIEFNNCPIIERGEGIYINNAIFRKVGTDEFVVVDRDETDFDVDEKDVSMTWCDVYIWKDAQFQNYKIDADRFNREYEFVGFLYEDDIKSHTLRVNDNWCAS